MSRRQVDLVSPPEEAEQDRCLAAPLSVLGRVTLVLPRLFSFDTQTSYPQISERQ